MENIILPCFVLFAICFVYCCILNLIAKIFRTDPETVQKFLFGAVGSIIAMIFFWDFSSGDALEVAMIEAETDMPEEEEWIL